MRPRLDLIVREVQGETVILDRSTDQLHTLNATASFIWSQLDGRKTVQDVALVVSRMFGVDVGVAERDVSTLIDSFRDQQLLQEEDPDNGTGEPVPTK